MKLDDKGNPILSPPWEKIDIDAWKKGRYTLYWRTKYFTIAHHGTWVEGFYETPEAAVFAAKMCPSKLSWAWNASCPMPMSADFLKRFAELEHADCYACGTKNVAH